TEVVRAQRRGFEEAVVEGKIVGSVVTERIDSVGSIKPVHRSAVVLGVHFAPSMTDVRSREAGEVIRLHEATCAVGLRVTSRHAVTAHPRCEAVIMVK